MIKLSGIKNLIKKNQQQLTCSMNIGISIYGKDQVSAPIPFYYNAYLVERPGDIMWREPKGDNYDSDIILFALKQIEVSYSTLLANSKEQLTLSILEKYEPNTIFTFGFPYSNFSILYNWKFYRVVSQRKVYNDYYVLKGQLSV